MRYEEGDMVLVRGTVGIVRGRWKLSNVFDYVVEIEGKGILVQSLDLSTVCYTHKRLMYSDEREKYICPFCE